MRSKLGKIEFIEKKEKMICPFYTIGLHQNY
jgi:hypothetical protein